MELTPSQVSAATFNTVRKGYAPDEVDAFLAQTATALEQAQQQAASMEARARAAVTRLQELSAGVTPPSSEPARTEPTVGTAEAETISRTLLLAQRTADATVAEARAEAERIVAEARAEAETTIDSTREMSAQLLEDARSEARRASEAELEAIENEVQSLVARREFLIGDVDQLEQFLVDQRERLRSAAREIETLCERVPGGLGTLRPPVLSAAGDAPDSADEPFRPPTDEPLDEPGASADSSADDAAADDTAADDGDGELDREDGPAGMDDDVSDRGDEVASLPFGSAPGDEPTPRPGTTPG